MKLLNSDRATHHYKMLAVYHSRAQNQKYTIITKTRAVLLVMELYHTIS